MSRGKSGRSYLKHIHALSSGYLTSFIILKAAAFAAQPDSSFILFSPALHPVIVVDSHAPGPVQTAAGLLARDIERVTGFKPDIRSEISDLQNPAVVIGTVTSPLFGGWPETIRDLSEQLSGQWEVYAHRFIRSSSGPFRTMIICGSDARGTAYGVIDISRKIGVSPWIWKKRSSIRGRAAAVPMSMPCNPEPIMIRLRF